MRLAAELDGDGAVQIDAVVAEERVPLGDDVRDPLDERHEDRHGEYHREAGQADAQQALQRHGPDAPRQERGGHDREP